MTMSMLNRVLSATRIRQKALLRMVQAVSVVKDILCSMQTGRVRNRCASFPLLVCSHSQRLGGEYSDSPVFNLRGSWSGPLVGPTPCLSAARKHDSSSHREVFALPPSPRPPPPSVTGTALYWESSVPVHCIVIVIICFLSY